ncbi:MAG: hypothetical protein M5R42_05445 [Rhodocyclaceae bacterium]|nr:hypothetical protein [Rhodocyclaceae bacterium]
MPATIIESLDHEGRACPPRRQALVFIEGALPQEQDDYSSYRRKPNYELATATGSDDQRLARRAALQALRHLRRLQHASTWDASGQAATKQRRAGGAFWHLARCGPEVIYPAIFAPAWSYRSRRGYPVRPGAEARARGSWWASTRAQQLYR